MKSILALTALLATATHATAAHAAPRRHDGFYLRLGLGGGAARGTMTGATGSASTGAAIASELAVGVTPRPGLVVGVGTFPMVAPSPSYDAGSAGGQHVSGTGPFVDYFLDDRGGWHLRAGLLFAAGYLDGSATRAAATGVGVGGTVGAGYDRFVTDAWSVGALARVSAYQLAGVDDSIRLIAPALLVTATYH
ncbi:MAG: hypothetical protein JNK64_03625 [Myxococcales bacterium]|nr:hypothetical protein [Myxococcales bacterium]